MENGEGRGEVEGERKRVLSSICFKAKLNEIASNWHGCRGRRRHRWRKRAALLAIYVIHPQEWRFKISSELMVNCVTAFKCRYHQHHYCLRGEALKLDIWLIHLIRKRQQNCFFSTTTTESGPIALVQINKSWIIVASVQFIYLALNKFISLSTEWIKNELSTPTSG